MLMKRGGSAPKMECARRRPSVPEQVQAAVTARGGGKAKSGPHAGWHCLDCKVSTAEDGVNEYYMVNLELWMQVNPARKGMLCIGCLETRLGRRLRPDDFTHAPINSVREWHSERLRSRIEGREERVTQ
jgi:hypothetical protein